MKKLIAIMICAVMLCTLTACGARGLLPGKTLKAITLELDNQVAGQLQSIAVSCYVDDDIVSTEVVQNADGTLLKSQCFSFTVTPEAAKSKDDLGEFSVSFSLTDGAGNDLGGSLLYFNAKWGAKYAFQLTETAGGYRISSDMGGAAILSEIPASPAASPEGNVLTADMKQLYELPRYFNDACPHGTMLFERENEKVFLSIEDDYIAVVEMDDDEAEAILPYPQTIDTAILCFQSMDLSDLDGDGYGDPTVTFDTNYDGNGGSAGTLVWFHTGEDIWTLNTELSTLALGGTVG